MNSDILKGMWDQVKGDVKKNFGKLTNDDLMIIEGDATKAAGLLQERYGYTRDEAEQRWDEFLAAQISKNRARGATEKVKSKM